MQRAIKPLANAATLACHLTAMPAFAKLRALSRAAAEADDALIESILDEAARQACATLESVNADGELHPPQLVSGRLHLSQMHRDAWAAYAQSGWLGLDLPADIGGQGLPLVLALAVQELFDRSCPAFGMLPVSIRSAVRLLGAWADEPVQAEWLPRLATGEWGATICISEVGAGSDAARIRTTAVQEDITTWRITGEKQWISFGDHDAVGRIGHCLIARTAGAKGLSLFLVPNTIDGQCNGVSVLRVEEKLGLHLSPTCALSFENAKGVLLGQEGRGLAQMFVMITNMRLAVGAMGLGIAAGALDVAWRYALERRQGGGDAMPIAIAEHVDVQRQLTRMLASVEMLRGLCYRVGVHADLAQIEHDGAGSSALLVEWLLPIVKTLGGEIGFSVASDAIQVLGAAGYTRDWPVEQSLRDARVLTIFEGTTGMQAIDLLHRRLWRDDGKGLAAFLTIARDVPSGEEKSRVAAVSVFDALERSADLVMSWVDDRRRGEAAADALLKLAAEAALSWVALEVVSYPGNQPPARRLRRAAQLWLEQVTARATMLESEVARAQPLPDGIDELAAIFA